MRPTGKLLAILLMLALAAPATALAQSAGDEQYVDPFQGQQCGGGGGGGGGGGNNSQGGGSPTTPSAQTAPTDTGNVAAQTSSSETAGATLPRTGLPLLPVVLTGLFMFGAGLTIRRLTAPAIAPALGASASPQIGLARGVVLGLLRRRA